MVFALYLSFYGFGLLLSRWHNTVRGAVRSGAAVTVAAIVAGVTVAGLLSQQMMGALLFGAFIAITCLPALMLGVGMLAGAGLKATVRARGWPWRGAILATTLVPVALGVTWSLGAWSNLQATKAVRAAQTMTVKGAFRGYPVALPLTPHLQVQWDCGASAPCRARLDRSDDGLLATDNPEFLRIAFAPVHPTCTGPDAPLNDCTLQATMEEWCAYRPDYTATAMCREMPRHMMFFWVPDKAYHPAHSLGDYAEAGRATLDGQAHVVMCNVTRDNVRSANDLSRLCGVNWAISPGVMAGIRLDKFADEALAEGAEAMMRIAASYWSDLRQ